LKDFELANIIRVLDQDKKKETTKISASLRGAITKERAIVLLRLEENIGLNSPMP
jgi:hypothetical protein